MSPGVILEKHLTYNREVFNNRLVFVVLFFNISGNLDEHLARTLNL